MKRLTLCTFVAAAMVGLGVWQANASLVGTTADYDLYDSGSYGAGSVPVVSGPLLFSGTATWATATLGAAGTMSALTPGGIETGPGYDAWFPLGYRNFSAIIHTSFSAPADGTYSFGTFSDDGSALYVDGLLVVNNGGEHAPVFVAGTMFLSAGIHTLRVDYYEGDPLFQANLTAYADARLAAVPEPSTYVAGALLLLPFGAQAVRRLRVRKQVS